MTRRSFVTGAMGAYAFRDDTLRLVTGLTKHAPDPVDERFWTELRRQFHIDPRLTVFNHVGLSPSPKMVLEAQAAEAKRANTDPSYVIWRQQDHELDAVRVDMAKLVGCRSDELALTMNATYGLQTGILGVPIRAGDELLTTSHDYPRAITAIRQRVRREGAAYVEAPLESRPLDDKEVVRRVLDKLTPSTKLVTLCQITYLMGQILPIKPIADVLAAREIPLLLDGAQAIGLMPDTVESMNVPMYTACLHKWLMGPIGTGVFVVRKPWIRRIWPLHPADEEWNDSITKFEQVGTRPAAPFLALKETLEFHHRLGMGAKAARLQALRERLASHFLGHPGVRHYGSLDPNVCRAMLTVGFDKVETRVLAGWLYTKHRIHVTSAVRAGVDGIRISPNVFTTFEEVDRLGKILADVAANGI